MFRNYLLVTFRNLYKNRVFALINILGLGIALAVCIVAYFNHMFGYGFDRQHEHFDTIYRVNSFRLIQDREQESGLIPAPLGVQLKEDVPAVIEAARLIRSYSPVRVGIDNFNRNISYVDPEFLDIFTLPLKRGNKMDLENPNNILISEELALALFGEEDPVGRSISIYNDNNEEYAYTVAGIFKDLPLNSSFRIDVLTNLENFMTMWNVDETSWTLFVRALFIRVEDPELLPRVQEGLRKYIPVQNEANENFTITDFNIVPLKEVKNNTRDIWNSALFPGLHPAAVVGPMVMAIVMLLIASFNFANTAIASAGRRLNEIGIRKMVGGKRKQLMVQFLMENYVICFLALLVAIVVARFLIPAYSSMWEYMHIYLTFSEYWGFWVFLVVLLLVTGFLAGTYPAFYISSFRPLAILQSRTRLGRGGPLAKILLGFQFTVSVLSIVSGVIFSMNAVYQETADLGYARKELAIVPVQPQNFTAFYEAVTQNPKVRDASGVQHHIGFGYARRSVEDEDQEMEVNEMDVGPGYLRTMGLTLLDGRGFDRDRVEADRSNHSIVINQMMADAFGWEDPVDRQLRVNDTVIFTVIGMVKDFYISGMWYKIEPTFLRLPDRDNYYGMAVRASQDDLPEVFENLRETWIRMFPNYPFEGTYQEDLLEEEKTINRSIKQVYIFLAIVATLLSMTGLYTLISLSILNRTKEIGIRKVMGAPVRNIFLVLSRAFMINLAISSLLGCAGGYFTSLILLKSIWDNYLDFTPWIYVYSLVIIFLVTLVTIAGKVYHAAMLNPTTCLRYE